MNENVDRTLLSIESDLRAINSTIKDIDRVRAAQSRLADEAKKASIAGEQSAKRLVKSYDDVRKAAEAAAKASADRARAAKDLLGGASTGLGAAGSVVSGLAGSGAAEGLRIGGDIAGLAENLPRLKEGLEGLPDAIKATVTALGPGGLALGGGLLAVGAAFALLNSALDAARESTRKRIQAEIDYNTLVVGETQRTIDIKLDAARQDAELARLNVETAQKNRDDLYQAYLDAGNIFDSSNLFASYSEADKVLEESLVKLNDATAAERNLLAVRSDGRVVARTLEEAEAELAKRRQAATDQLADTQLQTELRIASLTSEQAQRRMEDIRNEIAARDALIQSGTLSNEKTEQYRNIITNLGQELVTLTTEGLAVIQAREAEIKAIEEQEKAFQNTAKAMEQFNADIQSIEDRTSEQRMSIAEKLSQAIIDIDERRIDALKDRDKSVIKAGIEAADERAKNEADANEQRLEEQKRHKEAEARIDSDFETSKLNALARRDVLGVRAAEETRKAAKEEEDKQNKDRLAEIEKSFTKQNDAIARKLSEANDSIQEKYDEQIVAADEATRKQREAARADLSALDSKYASELLKRNAHHITELSLLAAHYTTREALERQHLERLNAQAQQFLSGSSSNSSSGRGGSPSALSPISLPAMPQGSSSRVGGGSSGNNGGGSNTNVTFTLGASGRQIELKSREAAHRALDQVLKEAGF